MVAFLSISSVSASDYTPLYPLSGNIRGLTLLIDFPDVNCSITKQDIDDMLNQTGYTGYENSCSVKDYFYRCSGGELTYTNAVADYYTAPNNKSYYDDNSSFYDNQARTDALIKDALEELESNGFDFSTLTVDSENNVLGLSVLYEGNPSYQSRGLYPHVTDYASIQVGGVNFKTYLISNIGIDDLEIGTFIHETGHSLCKWPDNYYYLSANAQLYQGTGGFDIMSTHAYKNPPPPNPLLRNIISGWGTAISLNDYPDGSRISVTPNSVDSYVFRKSPDSTDFYMIESLDNQQEYTSMPGSGLAIYYVDELARRIPVELIEADGLKEIYNNINEGEPQDLFYEGNNNSFTPYTTPSTTKYHDSSYGIPLHITQINSSGTEFTYHGTLLGMPEDLSLVNDGANIKLTWDNVTGASEYEVSIDDSSYVSTGLNTYYTIDNTSSHKIKVRAKDAYGRISNTAQAVGIKYGDINEDGQITIADKNLLTDYLLDPTQTPLTNEQLIAADVNGDSLIDSLDCTNINMYANGIISEFPGGRRLKLVIYGDLSGDGLVTEEDIEPTYWNWSQDVWDSRQKVAADVNGNGVVDFDDLTAIDRYISGVFLIFPYNI